MPAASGPNVNLSYVIEPQHGVTPPTPAMKTFRTIGRNINRTKGALRSPEITRSRQRRTVRHGFRQVAGGLAFNLGMEDFDDWLRLALSGTWGTASSGSATLEAVAPNIIRRAAGSWYSDGFSSGMPVSLTGFTSPENNLTGVYVSAISATDLTLETGAIVAEAAGAGRSVNGEGSILRVGNQLVTATVERRFEDAGLYQQFTGCAVNGLTINLAPEAIVGGTVDILGVDGTGYSPTTLGAPSDPSEREPFDAFTGRIMVKGEEIGTVTGMTITIANNRALSPVLMRKTSSGIFEGPADITGRITAQLWDDSPLPMLFEDEEVVEIDLRMDDLDGEDFHRIFMPRVKFLGDSSDPPQTGPVIMDMPWEALEDTDFDTALLYQVSNAP